jgi:hypothetical protein
MTFEDTLRVNLKKQIPSDKLNFVKGWRTRMTGPWRSNERRPEILMAHHTAGAATDSTDPSHRGNQKGANNGIINWCIKRDNAVPYCNAVIDRDGSVYILSAGPVWHAGKGSFAGTRWNRFNIPNDSANSYTFGVEIVSKGMKKDFTKAQIDSLKQLYAALRASSDWPGNINRICNHKDWAGKRKVDTRYSLLTLINWAVQGWRGRKK